MNEEPSFQARRRVGFCVLVSFLALSLSGSPLRGGAKASPDVALTDDQVYVADPGRGAVLQGAIRPGRLPFGQLAPLAALSEVKQPIAIDVRGARLVVLDAYGPTVYDVDLRANTVKTLVRGAPLREPTGIAIAAGGTVAVTDPANRALFLFADGKDLQIDRRFSVPLQVEFDPSETALYVYDAERGLLRVEYSSVDNFVRMRNAERIATALTGITRVFSFAPRRGLLYVADESGLRVAILAKRSSLSVPPQYYRRRFTSIALHTQYLAGIDDAGTTVEIVDRPLPVSVTLEPEEGDPNAGMLALLDYVASKRLLAARGVDAEPNEPYDKILTRYNVLTPTWLAAKAPDPSRVKSVFCGLNPRRCGAGGAVEGDEIAIPQIALESFLTTVSKRPLAGRSIESHIDEKVDPSQRDDAKTDYLSKLNPTADGTLESELLRRKLVMAVPMSAALMPGAIIRVAGITDSPSGDLADRCGVPIKRESSTTFLPETITTRVMAALPDGVRAEAAAAGTSEVELGFDRVLRDTIIPPSRECLKDTGAPEYIVTESIRVEGLRYRIRSAPTRGRGGIASQTAPSQTWKVAPGSFVIAYKAVELSSAAFGLAERAIDPARLKPGLIDRKAILARSQGEANLPVTHWRFDVLVPASDMLSGTSPLADLRKAFPTIGLSSHERTLASARSAFLTPLPRRAEDVKVTLSEARKNLSKTIAYSDDLARGTSDVYVAVGEADEEVNQDHPGFVHNGLSAWFESTVSGLTRRRPPTAAPSGDAVEVHALARVDHGTHVSGIIGARPSSLMPGLTPEVRLFLVDTARNLTDAIQDAYDADLRIFNFSFSIKPDPDAEAEMKARMRQHWSDALFVVAAGNEGLNLNTVGAPPLVDWVVDFPNIIGVGASRADGLDLMGPQPDPAESGKTVPGSNFGSRFVQLIAPGEQIYSLGDQHYAFATGTSQAVPQVTSAAAILSLRMSGPRALKIKARLIATANWSAELKDKVWGGLLDVDRAVEHLQRNVVRLQSAPLSIRAITLGDDVKLKVRQATTYPADGSSERFVTAEDVLVRKILRLQHLGQSKFRIVMIDAGERLTIMFGRVEGKIACTSMEQYDPATAQFGPLPAGTLNPCAADGIPTQQLQDYVARAAAIPDRVKF